MALHMRNWVNVPDGSHLDVRVSGDDVVSRGRAQVERGGAVVRVEELADDDLKRGWRSRINRGETVSAIVFLTFVTTSAAQGTVAGSVEKPDGATYGKPFRETFSGVRGDPEIHVIFTASGETT